MADKVSVGDIVLSTCGRDKDKWFLVVKSDGKTALITDGRTRKVTAVKKKNIKHLKSVRIAVLTELAIKIQQGLPVGNERLFKEIKSQLKKED